MSEIRPRAQVTVMDGECRAGDGDMPRDGARDERRQRLQRIENRYRTSLPPGVAPGPGFHADESETAADDGKPAPPRR